MATPRPSLAGVSAQAATETSLPVRRVVSRSAAKADDKPVLTGILGGTNFSLPSRTGQVHAGISLLPAGGPSPARPSRPEGSAGAVPAARIRLLSSQLHRTANPSTAVPVVGLAGALTESSARPVVGVPQANWAAESPPSVGSNRPTVSLLRQTSIGRADVGRIPSSHALHAPLSPDASPGLEVLAKKEGFSPPGRVQFPRSNVAGGAKPELSLPPARYDSPVRSMPPISIISAHDEEEDEGITIIRKVTPAARHVSQPSVDDIQYDDEDGYEPVQLSAPMPRSTQHNNADSWESHGGQDDAAFAAALKAQAAAEIEAALKRAGITSTPTSSVHSALNLGAQDFQRAQVPNRGGLSLSVGEEPVAAASNSIKDRRMVDRGLLSLNVGDDAIPVKKSVASRTEEEKSAKTARTAWYDVDDTPIERGLALEAVDELVDELEPEDEELGELYDSDNENDATDTAFHEDAGGTIRVGGLAIGHSGLKYANIPRTGNIKSELIMLNELGRGASGIVQRGLHMPTLQLVAVKHIKIDDKNRQLEMARELKTLYANMVPLMRRRVMAFTSTTTPATTGSAPGHLFPSPRDTMTTGNKFSGIFALPATRHLDSDGMNSTLDGTLGETSFGATMQSGIGDSSNFDATMNATDTFAGLAANGEPMDADTNPYLIRFYDAFVNKGVGTVSIVCEYMGGGSLQEVVDCGGCQDERVLARIAAHVLRGLHFLHKNHQLHRDIKPANILMTTNGDRFKVADFGIAKQLDSTVAHARTWVGTMIYMSPERLQTADDGYSFPSDIWSFGLTLLAVAAGKFPYDQRGYWDMLKCIKDDPPPLHVLAVAASARSAKGKPVSFSNDFHSFLQACLEKDPRRRLTAEELLKHPFIIKHVNDMQQLKTTRADAKETILEEPQSVSSVFDAGSLDVLTADVGIPISRSSAIDSRFTGDFAGKSPEVQEKLLRLVKDSIRTLMDDVHWPAFVRYFRRFKNKRRRKWYFSLDETSFNAGLAEKFKETVGAGFLQLPRFARTTSDGGIEPPTAAASTALPDAASRSQSMGVSNQVPKGGLHMRQHSKDTVNHDHPSEAVTYRELRLDAADLEVLSRQLGVPMLWILPAFNEAIKQKLGVGGNSAQQADASARGNAMHPPVPTHTKLGVSTMHRHQTIVKRQENARAELEKLGLIPGDSGHAPPSLDKHAPNTIASGISAALQANADALRQNGIRRPADTRLPPAGFYSSPALDSRQQTQTAHGTNTPTQSGHRASAEAAVGLAPSPANRKQSIADEMEDLDTLGAEMQRRLSTGSRPGSGSSATKLAPIIHTPSSFGSPAASFRTSTPSSGRKLPAIETLTPEPDARSGSKSSGTTPLQAFSNPSSVRGEVASVHLRTGSHSVLIPEMPSARSHDNADDGIIHLGSVRVTPAVPKSGSQQPPRPMLASPAGGGVMRSPVLQHAGLHKLEGAAPALTVQSVSGVAVAGTGQRSHLPSRSTR